MTPNPQDSAVALEVERAIREALAAGPTPGPWMVPHFARDEVKCNCGYVFSEFQHGMGSICEVNHGAEDEPVEVAKANARLIAACNPEAMRALLAEIDRLRASQSDGTSGWQPIETAPKDEHILIAATPDWVFEARQDLNCVGGEQVWQWVHPGGEPLHANLVPIAWMPKPAFPTLPAAPNQGENHGN